MNPLAIALQGIGFGALLVAVQGFAPVGTTAAEPQMYYSVGKEAHMRRLHEEDEILLAALQVFVTEA